MTITTWKKHSKSEYCGGKIKTQTGWHKQTNKQNRENIFFLRKDIKTQTNPKEIKKNKNQTTRD